MDNTSVPIGYVAGFERLSDAGDTRPDLEEIIDRLKGVACILFSLSVSSDSGSHKYAGSEMSLMSNILNNLICDLESISNCSDGVDGTAV